MSSPNSAAPSQAAPAGPPTPAFPATGRSDHVHQYVMPKSPMEHNEFRNSLAFPMSIFGGFIATGAAIVYMGRKRNVKLQLRVMEARVGAQALAVASLLGLMAYLGTGADMRKEKAEQRELAHASNRH